MLIYHINNLFILLWTFLFFGIKSKKYRETPKTLKMKKIAFLSLCFAQLFLLSIFRKDIGFDYQMYNEGFYRMWRDGFSTMQYLDWEIGFVFLTKSLVFVTHSHLVYMGILAFLCLAPMAWFIYKYSSQVWLSVILYVNLYFYYISLNFLRQAIALSITLFAWPFLKKKKFFWFLLVILAASLFHSTALILIPVYFVLKIKPSSLLVLFYCYMLLFFFISSDGFLNLLTTAFHQEYQNSALIREGLSLIYSLMPCLIAIAAMLMKDKLLRLSKSNRYLIALAVLSAALSIIMSKHAILERLSYYSSIYCILLAPQMFDAVKQAEKEKRAQHLQSHREKLKTVFGVPRSQFVFVTCALVLPLIYNLYGMIVGVHGVFPYISWLQ